MTTTDNDPSEDERHANYMRRYFPGGVTDATTTAPGDENRQLATDMHAGARQSVTTDEHEAALMGGLIATHFPDRAA